LLQVADLESLAKELNPTVGFYDPLGLASSGMGEPGTLASEEAIIGFLRAAEIKHGRVAMAAFVGFIVQSNGIHFPWDLTTSGISHADIAAAGGPAAQWDALPTASKLQIFGAIGFLEGYALPFPCPAVCHARPRWAVRCTPVLLVLQVGRELEGDGGAGAEALHAWWQARLLPLVQGGAPPAPPPCAHRRRSSHVSPTARAPA
jgi:hypothetical protein